MFNSANTIARCVHSIKATKYENLELVVIDDGSADNSLNVARLACDEAAIHKTVFLQHPDHLNHGAAASRNLGLATCTGDLVCFLDADDVYLPNRFLEAINILSSNPTVDAVYETAEVVDGGDPALGCWGIGSIFGITTALFGSELLQKVIQGFPWPTSAILFKRSLIDATGGFDESLVVAEDSNLWMKMIVVGNVVPGNLAEPVSQYIRRENSLYQPGLDRKLDYFKALRNFAFWMSGRNVSKEQKSIVSSKIDHWIDHALIEFRKQNRFDLVLRLYFQVLRMTPGSLYSRRVLAHVVFGALEYVGLRKLNAP